jgi:hypothetical protein
LTNITAAEFLLFFPPSKHTAKAKAEAIQFQIMITGNSGQTGMEMGGVKLPALMERGRGASHQSFIHSLSI